MDAVIDEHVILQVQRDYFSTEKSPVCVSMNFEGQGINDSGQFILGCRAGPEIAATHLLHEMAHFAEREVKKLKKRPLSSWGFKFGKSIEIPEIGYSGFEFSGTQHIEREISVFGYHLNLAKKYGVDETAHSLASVCKYLQNFFMYGSHDDVAINVIAEKIESAAAGTFTLQRFEIEWRKRLKALS